MIRHVTDMAFEHLRGTENTLSVWCWRYPSSDQL